MTRIELVRRLRELAGVAGGSTGNGPATTINQTGEFKRLVDWIDSAWAEVQREHKWGFLWEAATVTITSGTYVTAGTIAAQRYEQDSAWVGTKKLTYRPWQRFREEYPTALIAAGEPSVWTIRPDMAFVVNAQPTSDTAIAVERYGNGTAMAADADTPTGLPAQHHELLVYKALLLYANFEEAGVTRLTAEAEYNRHMMALGLQQLPDWSFAGPLA